MDQSWYEKADVKDFLRNDDFVRWVIHPDAEGDGFWQGIQQRYPAQKKVMAEAAALIREYRYQETENNKLHQEEVWNRINRTLENATPRQRTAIFRLTPALKIAAAILVIVTGVALWYVFSGGNALMKTVTTAYGEIKTITLPDHSTVTINGNSTVRYRSSWKKSAVREVWIKGEAYFNVLHLNKDTLHVSDHERFVVHCDDLNIEVLGTTFNVKARRGKTNVALLTGKIMINYKEPAKQPMVMTPGDYVEYTEHKVVVSKKLTKPLQVTTWKSNEIAFTDATLKEIAETLQDNYGYTVIFKDPSILSMKIEGDISVNSVTDLLDVVGTTLHVNIEQSADKHIVISK